MADVVSLGGGTSASAKVALKQCQAVYSDVAPRPCGSCGKSSHSRNPEFGPEPSEIQEGASDSEVSPEDVAHLDENGQGHRPWGRYKRHGVETDKKVVTGDYCGICESVFVEGGYNLEHGTLPVYMKSICSDPTKHAPFLRGVKEEIKINREARVGDAQVNAAARKRRVRGTILTVVTSSEIAGTKKVRRRTFIHKDVFNARYAGKVDIV